MKLGTLIKEYRNRRGLEISELSKLTGLNMNSLKKYERAGADGGAFPPLDKLTRICAVLEIDPREVFAVSSESDIDTSVFFKFDDRKNTPEKVSETLEQTNAILRRYGFPETTCDQIDDIDDVSDLDMEGMPIHEAIRTAVMLTGVETRALPTLISDAREVFSSMESGDLLELAESRFLLPSYSEGSFDVDGLFDEDVLNELPLKERDTWCINMSEVIIANAIYGPFLWYLTTKSILELCTKYHIKSPPTLFFEETLFQLASSLNQSIEKREPTMLHDENQFAWTEDLHRLCLETGFVLHEGDEPVSDNQVMRCFDKYGILLGDITVEPGPFGDTPGSKSSLPDQRKEVDDG